MSTESSAHDRSELAEITRWLADGRDSEGRVVVALGAASERSIQRELCALANSGGGVLVIGARSADDAPGALFGADPEERLARIAAMCTPPLDLGVRIVPVDDRHVIAVTVAPGSRKVRTATGVVYERVEGVSRATRVTPPTTDPQRRRVLETVGQFAGLLAAAVALVYLAGGGIVVTRLERAGLPASVAAQLPREVLISVGLLWLAFAVVFALLIVGVIKTAPWWRKRIPGVLSAASRLWRRWGRWGRWALLGLLVLLLGVAFAIPGDWRLAAGLLVLMTLLAVPFVLLVRRLEARERLSPNGALFASALLGVFVLTPSLLAIGTGQGVFKQAKACMEDGTIRGGLYIGQTASYVYIGELNDHRIVSIPATKARAVFIADEVHLDKQCPASSRAKGKPPVDPNPPAGTVVVVNKQGSPGDREKTVRIPSNVRGVLGSRRYVARAGTPLRVRYGVTKTAVATVIVEHEFRRVLRRRERASYGANATVLTIARPGRYRLRLIVQDVRGTKDIDEGVIVVKPGTD